MLESVLTTARQVAILFALMGAGVLCRRRSILSDVSAKEIVELLSVVVTPALIVHSFERPFDAGHLAALGWTLAASFLVHALGSLAALAIRMPDKSRQSVLRFATVFSNGGFMALPLEYALFGREGVFYGAVYVVVFNLVCWSWGIVMMRGSFQAVGWRQVLVNPGSTGVALGLPLFLFSLRLPPVVGESVEMVAAMNTPLAMVTLGYYLGGVDFRPFFGCGQAYLAFFLRLVAIPLVTIPLALAFRPGESVAALAVVTAASAPAAALTAMLAARYDRDVQMGVGVVAATTIASIVTMPVVMALAMRVFR